MIPVTAEGIWSEVCSVIGSNRVPDAGRAKPAVSRLRDCHSLFQRNEGWVCRARCSRMNEGDGVRKDVLLAITAFAFLTGCDNLDNKPYGPPPEPKATAPYHIEFDTKAAKPNPTGIALPVITYTANPKALERRAALVVRFDASGTRNGQPGKDRLVAAAVDIPGTGGKLPEYYVDSVDIGLAKLLSERCIKGTVKLSVALVRSTIRPDPDETEINAKRLSDWVPAEVAFKNPHSKCQAPR